MTRLGSWLFLTLFPVIIIVCRTSGLLVTGGRLGCIGTVMVQQVFQASIVLFQKIIFLLQLLVFFFQVRDFIVQSGYFLICFLLHGVQTIQDFHKFII